jgi:hypothetical protein
MLFWNLYVHSSVITLLWFMVEVVGFEPQFFRTVGWYANHWTTAVQLCVTAVVVLHKFPLYCSIESSHMELLSRLADDLFTTLCQFPSDSVSSFWIFLLHPFVFVVLTVVLQHSTTGHKGVKEKSFTKKRTESLGNWQSVCRRTDHLGVTGPRQQPLDSYTAVQTEQLKSSSNSSHM